MSEPEPRTEPDPLTEPITRWCTSHNFNPFADPTDSRISDADWFSDSDRDVSCFVTDLFDRRDSEQPPEDVVVVDPASASAPDPFLDDELVSNFDSGLGFGVDSNSQGSEFGGLRVVGLESDSDSDSDHHDNNNNDDLESNRVSEGIQSIWDSIFLEEQRNAYENNSEWEQSFEEQASAASGFSTEEEEDIPEGAARSIEWEILLTVNNFRRSVDNDDVDDDDDDDVLNAETVLYMESIFEEFVENASACKGGPPAASSVVEDLPFVEFTVEELRKEEAVCAVCKDDIVVEDTVRSLPCCHYYHQDCIVPWLSIRNTCPVCRYELPTDDADYERGAARGLQVRFGFEQFV